MLHFNKLLAAVCIGLLISCGPVDPEISQGSAAPLGQAHQATTALSPVSLTSWTASSSRTCSPTGCSPSAVVCSGGSSAETLTATFSDPAPAGSVVVQATAVVTGLSSSGTAGTTETLNLTLDNNTLGSFQTASQGSCSGTCDLPKTATSSTFSAGFPGYVYGGTNTLVINVPAGTKYCVAKVDLTLTVAQPKISVSPTSLSFGNQMRGTTSSAQTVTVTNTGDAPLHVSSYSIGTGQPFAVTGPSTPVTITPGSSQNLSVTFSPTAVGMVNGTLTLTSDASNGSTTTVNLSGTGVTTLSASPSSVTFPSQEVSTSSASTSVVLTNTGSGPLSISTSTTGAFSVSPQIAASTPYPLGAGKTLTLQVTFSPTATGAASGTLVIGTGEPVTPVTAPAASVTVPLSGTGVAAAANVSPAVLDFGIQRVGTTSTAQTVTVSNAGSTSLNISAISVTAFFAVSPTTPFSLAAGASQNLSVTFSPTAPGPFSGTLTLNTDDPNAPTLPVSLVGMGVQPNLVVSPTSIAFGEQHINTTSTAQTVTVSNTGGGPITITSVALGTGLPFAVSSPPTPFTLAAGSSQTLAVTFSPTIQSASTDTLILTTDYAAQSQATVSLSGTGVNPAVSVTPPSLAFGQQYVNTTSTPLMVTVKNTGSGTLNISGISTAAPFAVSPSTAFSLPAGSSQTLSVTFTPPTQNSFTGNLSFNTNDLTNPTVTVALSGTGVKPVLSYSPTSLDFGNQRVGTTSAALTVTVKNTGTGNLNISSVSTTGPFAATPSTASLAAGQSATLSVTFTPITPGSTTGTLSFTTNDPAAPNPSVTLSGTGVQPNLVVNTTPLNFGNQRVGTTSTAQTVTVSNNGSGPITVTPSINPGAPFAVSPGSAFTVAAGGSQTLFVTFSPTVEGSATGTLTLATDYSAQPSFTISLSGTGVKPNLVVNPTSLAFGEQHINTTSSPQMVTVSNNGSGPISITAVSLGAGASSPFAVTPSSAFTLAAGASQTLSVTFSPTAQATANDTLTLTTDYATQPSATVSLTGTGVDPTVSYTPTSIAFGQQYVNTTSAAQTVTVKNAGSGTLTIGAPSVTGPFAISPSTAFSLPAGASQTLSVTFTPTSGGPFSGSLTFTTNDLSAATVTIALSGTGANPNLSYSPTSLAFGNQRVGTTSAPLTVTVTNTGTSGTLNVGAPSVTGPFAVSPNTAFSLPAGASQTLSVTFTPISGVSVTGSLTLTTNDPAHPSANVSLSGTGVQPNLSVTPTSLTFGNQQLNTTSATQTVTVSNTGSGSISITGLSLSAGSPFAVSPSGPFTLAPNTSQTLSVTFTPTVQGPTTDTLTLTTDYAGQPSATVSLSGTGVKPTLTLSTTSLSFGQQVVGTSSTLTLTVKNSGTGTLVIGTLSATAPFSVSPSAPIALAAGASQPLSVTFSPTAEGPVTGTLTIASNDQTTPSATVSLSGTGTNPRLSLSPTSLAFGAQPTGTTTSTPMTVTVSNSGTSGTLHVTNLSISPATFAVTPNVPFDLPVGASQVLSVTFSPTAKTLYSGTLSFNTNDPSAPSPSIGLSGNGVSWLSLSTSSVNFNSVRVGTSSSYNVTLTNISSVPVTIQSLSALNAPFSFALPQGITLPYSLPGNSPLTFTVTFSPSSVGTYSTTLTVQSDASDSPQQLALTGKGAIPQAQLSLPNNPGQTTLDFGNVRVTTSAVATVRLTDVGGVPLTLLAAPTFSPGSPFSYIGPSTVTIQPGSYIDFQVQFQPTQPVISTDTLVVNTNDPSSPALMGVSGRGTYSELSLGQPSIFFGDQRVGTTSTPTTVSINNTGTAPLTVQSMSVTGPFSATLPSTESLPLVVQPGGSASFLVSFAPSAEGPQTGSVTLLTDANLTSTGSTNPDGGTENGGVAVLNLQGNGTIAAIQLSATSINFGNQRVLATSGGQPVIISNTGKAALDISQFIFSNPAFAISSPLPLPTAGSPLVIPAGQQQAVTVTFTPGTLGTQSGLLYIVSDAYATPAPLSLSGTGVDGQISTTPSTVAFSGVAVGSTGQQQQVTLTNTGGYPLTIAGVTQPTQTSFSVSGLSPGLVLKPGDQWPFVVTFAPTQRGYLTGTVVIQSDAVINPTYNLSVTGTGLAAAVALVPTTIDFGPSNLGVSTTQTLSINNVGELDLTVSNITFTDVPGGVAGSSLDFSLGTAVAFPLVVKAGTSSLVQLKFTPTALATRQAQVNVFTNDKTATAALQGVGTSPTLKLSSASLNFGNTLVGQPSSPLTLTLTNTGTGPLTVSAMSLGGADAANFTLTPPTLPITLQPQATTQASVSLTPNAERPFTGQLVIQSNDPTSPTVSVPLSGTGVHQQITLSQTTLDFGHQLINHTSSPRTVTITNSSGSNVTLTGLAVQGAGASQFTLSNPPLPLVLAPNQSQDVAAVFTPLAEPQVSCTLAITFGNMATPLTVTLQGNGIASVLSATPSPLDFGTVRVGATKGELLLTLTNLSSETIVLTAPDVTSSTGEPFIYDGASLNGLQLPAGMSHSLTVDYQPQVETLSQTTLAFGTTTPLLPRSVSVQLTGRGLQSLLSVDPTSLDFGHVDVSTASKNAPQTITVTNKASQPQRVVVKLKNFQNSPYVIPAKALADPIPAGGNATFTVAFEPTAAGQVDDEVQLWLQGANSPEVTVAVTGVGRTLTGKGGGCSCDSTEAGSTGLLALLAVVAARRQRRRRSARL